MFVIVLAILALFTFFLMDIMVPFMKMQMNHDTTGASELLRDKGLLGLLSVALVEALQMVVIFIPAAFIQISSGLSYPFPIALLVCDLGVGLGATIIFTLVRIFHFNSTAYEKRRKNIDRISANVQNRNTMFILYLLFFMPLIPFGAICYFGSGSKLSYRKYLFTVMTGVIPSIVVSNLMGAAGSAFLMNNLPLWLLVLIIVLLAAALFLIIALFMKKFILKGTEGTPDSIVYALTVFLARTWQRKPRHLEIEDELLSEVTPPYILLSNHESFADFNYISRLAHPKNPSYLVNEFYCTRPILKHLAKGGGFIPKKLFTPDMASAMGIRRTIRRGYPVVIFPEGRLSPDGRPNPLIEGAAFYKKLNVDLVLVKINGAYFSQPKWRRKRYYSRVRVKVERIIRKEELQGMENQEIEATIAQTLRNNASENQIDRYRQRTKAVGLENLLYRCPDCGSLYTTRGTGNDLICTSCGSVRTLGEDYRFSNGGKPSTIPEYYDAIKVLEEKTLSSFELQAKVRTKIFGENGGPMRKEEGECFMNSEVFRYHSASEDFTIPLSQMPALAFSCNEEFELYHNDELHYFYPVDNRRQVVRWALLVDMLAKKRKDGGK